MPEERLARLVMNKLGTVALGVYVTIHLTGGISDYGITKLGKIPLWDTRKIVNALTQLGLVKKRGDKIYPVIDEVSDDAKEAYAYFADRIGQKSPSNKWRTGQLQEAEKLVREHGLAATKWMTDYILDVKKMDMYSLKLQSMMAEELKGYYDKHLEARQRIQSQEKEDFGWKDATPHVDKKEKDVDLSQIMNFGIEL